MGRIDWTLYDPTILEWVKKHSTDWKGCQGYIKEKHGTVILSNTLASHWASTLRNSHDGQSAVSREDLPETTTLETTTSDNSGTVVYKGPAITVPELIAKAKIDPAEWQVSGIKQKEWQGYAKNDDGQIELCQMCSLAITLKPASGFVTLIASLKDEVLGEIKAAKQGKVYGPRKYSKSVSGGPTMLELSPFDLHVGKLAWGIETGEDYDSAIASERLERATDDLLNRAASSNVEKVLFVVGNDLLHSDNAEGTTTAGTRQDVDSRHQKMFRTARRLMSWGARRCAELAPVEILIIPGNHDTQSAWFLGEVLAAEFEGHPTVVVENTPNLRKYVEYGTNLLGFCHGRDEKVGDLPLIMAQEQGEAWARTTHREFHLGHLHKRSTTKFIAGDTHGGVVVRVLPSLSAADAWHHQKGYVCNDPAAEAYLWDFEAGYAGHLNHTSKRAA